jgi:hypothetical protein
MIDAVELPARVPDLDTGLADVDRDAPSWRRAGAEAARGNGEEEEARREASSRSPASAVRPPRSLSCASRLVRERRTSGGCGGGEGKWGGGAAERGEFEVACLCGALCAPSRPVLWLAACEREKEQRLGEKEMN